MNGSTHLLFHCSITLFSQNSHKYQISQPFEQNRGKYIVMEWRDCEIDEKHEIETVIISLLFWGWGCPCTEIHFQDLFYLSIIDLTLQSCVSHSLNKYFSVFIFKWPISRCLWIYLQCLTAVDVYSSHLPDNEVSGVCPDIVCAGIIFPEISTNHSSLWRTGDNWM